MNEVAADALTNLFQDGGSAVVRESGLGSTWAEALQRVPPAILTTHGSAPAATLLRVLRDHWSQTNQLRPAIAATRGLLRVSIDRSGHQHPDTLVELGALGALAQRAGRIEEGAGMLEKSWRALRSVAGGRDLRLAVVSSNMALHLVRSKRLEEARVALEIAYRIRTVVAPETAGQAAAQLGEVLVGLGQLDEGVRLLTEALELYRKRLGPEHGLSGNRAQALGALLVTNARYKAAVEVLDGEEARATRRGNAEQRAAIAFDLGISLYQTGSIDRGLRLMEEAVRYTRGAGSADGPHRMLSTRVSRWAQVQQARRRPAEAEGLLMEAVEADKMRFGEASAEVAERYANLGKFLAQMGRIDEAMGWLDVSASLMRSTAGDADPRTRVIVDAQVRLLVDRAKKAIERRDKQFAATALHRAWSLAAPVLGFKNERTRSVRELADMLGLRL